MAYIGRDTDKISNVEVLDNITFDGSSSYTLQKGGSNFTPSSANTLLVSINGVVQAGNFTVSGSTIDFGTAVAGTSTCDFILHYGIGLITTPADGTVTNDKINYPLAKSGAIVSTFNRTTSDGSVLDIQKDGTTRGIIATESDGLIFSNDTRGIKVRDDACLPRNVNLTTADNIIDLGTSGSRFKDIYLGGGAYLGGTGTANKLDDYEEGTWTPVVGGVSLGAVGFYSKVGRVCIVSFANQTGAGLALNNGANYAIAGLPFSMIATDWNYASVPSASFADASASYHSQPLTGRQQNTGNIHIVNRSGIDVTSSDPVNVSMVYQTN